MGKTTKIVLIGYRLLALGLTASFSLQVQAIWLGEPPVENLRQEDELVAGLPREQPACRQPLSHRGRHGRQ